MTSTCLFQSGQRSRKSFWACKTCTHVSYQRISILTLNFNTSFVGHLANVATLEYFTLTVFFSVFVGRCSRVWFGCVERYTWLAVLTRTHVFPGHGMCSSGPRGNSRILGIVAVWSTAVSAGRVFCILVVSYGHVSLIVDQLDWQRCQSHCGTVVEWSWDHW